MVVTSRNFFSLAYSLGQISLGLLLHPYATMQTVAEEKVFSWLTLLPTGFLAVVTVLWRFIVVPLVQLVFHCSQAPWQVCELLPFISNWLTFFCVFWQVLLFYLFSRFSWFFRFVEHQHAPHTRS